MKKILFCLFFLTSAIMQSAEPEVILLWPKGVPESNGITEPEVTENERISNISIPSMRFYPADPSKNTGVTILICPGGGYIREAAVHEGTQFGEWLSKQGINAFILKYRLPNKHAYIPLKDAQQAMQIIRSRSAEWKLNPSKIGVSGFSAGGHLASTLGTHFDKSNRPDFMILFYPVVSMQESVTHAGSRENLLGLGYRKDSVNYYSNELQVTKDTPPTLLFLSGDDGSVPPQNSIDFYLALQKFKVPASMYIFPEGGHGWGFHETFRYHETWKGLYIDWLKERKIL
ncbi:MAG TPA: alpha/beta hydrolase [Bacteroidales bacterium]|nr:alpha/beta hydrolase [Bacteroidales bacterium]